MKRTLCAGLCLVVLALGACSGAFAPNTAIDPADTRTGTVSFSGNDEADLVWYSSYHPGESSYSFSVWNRADKPVCIRLTPPQKGESVATQELLFSISRNGIGEWRVISSGDPTLGNSTLQVWRGYCRGLGFSNETSAETRKTIWTWMPNLANG